jgi:hypothetical protein
MTTAAGSRVVSPGEEPFPSRHVYDTPCAVALSRHGGLVAAGGLGHELVRERYGMTTNLVKSEC